MNKPGETISEMTLREDLEKLQLKYNRLLSKEETEFIQGQYFNMPIRFGFDIKETNVEALKDDIGFILWSLIKQNHLTDQYFDENVMKAVEEIRRRKPKNYFEFRAAVSWGSLLSNFGTYYIEYTGSSTTNDIFWLGVYHYIKNPQEFIFEYDGEIMNLSTKNFAFVNPQLFI